MLAKAEIDSSNIINPIFPSRNQSNISILLNEIKLYSLYEIDTANVIKETPYLYDSVYGKINSQILILRKDIYEELPDSLWARFAINAYISFSSPDSINIQLDSTVILEYNTSYVLVLKNLNFFVQNEFDSTITDTITISGAIDPWFKTTSPPIDFISASFEKNKNLVMSNEKIILYFSDSLKSNDTQLGKIAEIGSNFRKIYEDSVHFYYIYDTVSANYNIINNGKSIEIVPLTNYALGEKYLVIINLYPINGTGAKIYKQFTVKDHASLEVITKAKDTSFILPRECISNLGYGELSLYPGDSTFVSVPTYYDNQYCFIGWECAEDTTFNIDTTLSFIKFATNDTNLIDRVLIAKYDKIPIDTILVPQNVEGGSLNVYGYYENLGEGRYTIPAHENYTLFVSFNPLPGFNFESWSSNDSKYNGSNNQILSISPTYYQHIKTGGIIIIDPVVRLDQWEDCSCANFHFDITYNNQRYENGEKYGFDILPAVANAVIQTVGVQVDDGDGVFETVEYVADEYGQCNIQLCGAMKPEKAIITAQIAGSLLQQFEIQEYSISGNGWGEIKRKRADYYYVDGGWKYQKNIDPIIEIRDTVGISESAPPGRCPFLITIKIRRKIANVIIEREMVENKPLPKMKTFGYSIIIPPPTVFHNKYPPDEKPEEIEFGDYKGFNVAVKATRTYQVAVGSTITIMPGIEENSGTKFFGYNCMTPYICTPVMEPDILQLFIEDDSDKHIKLLGEEKFRLEFIQFDRLKYLENPNEPPSYESKLLWALFPPEVDTDDIWHEEKNYDNGIALRWSSQDVPSPNNNHTKTARITLYFNKPVDLSSLESDPAHPNQGIWIEEICTDNNNKRLDGKTPKNFYFKLHNPENPDEIYGIDYNMKVSSNDYVIELLLINTEEDKYWVTNYQQLKFNFSENIKNIPEPGEETEYLDNYKPNSLINCTVPPGMIITLDTLWVNSIESCKWPSPYTTPDIEAYSYSVVFTNNGSSDYIPSDNPFEEDKDGRYVFYSNAQRYPSQGYKSIDAFSAYNWIDDINNRVLYYSQQLYDLEGIGLYFYLIDKGAGNPLGDIASSIITNAISAALLIIPEPATKLAAFGLKFVTGLVSSLPTSSLFCDDKIISDANIYILSNEYMVSDKNKDLIKHDGKFGSFGYNNLYGTNHIEAKDYNEQKYGIVIPPGGFFIVPYYGQTFSAKITVRLGTFDNLTQ